MIPSFVRGSALVICLFGAVALRSSALAQTNYYSANGTENAIVGALPSDQTFPDVAISTGKGFVVWQDKATDGSGWGISASRLNSTSADINWVDKKINVQGTGDQEHPRVALLKTGGAVFVWQGGRQGFQHVYARFVTTNGTFLPPSNDITVSTPTNNFQINPAVAVLSNGNAVVVWSSYNQAGADSMQDVYAQILSPTGQPVGANFLVNQFTRFNQRTPAIAALPAGGFVVTWVSEQQNQAAPAVGTNASLTTFVTSLNPSVDIYARLFNFSGVPVGDEFCVNTDAKACANPSVAASADGSYMVVWMARDLANSNDGLDIYGRTFLGNTPSSLVFYVNARLFGDQFLPRVSAQGTDYLVTWSSLGQDGDGEGVYGRFLRDTGSLLGSELRINSTTVSDQRQPAVAADGVGQFMVVWTTFKGYPSTFDLSAQSFASVSSVLTPVSVYVWRPFVVVGNRYQPQLQVSWSLRPELAVSNYEVYVDGATTPTALIPAALETNQWILAGLTTNSTHSFQVRYVLTDGRRSPVSDTVSGTTWGDDQNWGGIPFQWMQGYYGSLNFVFGPSGITWNWPNADAALVPGGPTPLQVFLSGGDPTNSATWLVTRLTKNAQGLFLSWNAQPGATYQVQVTTNFISWSDVDKPQFAAEPTEQKHIDSSSVGYYRVKLLR